MFLICPIYVFSVLAIAIVYFCPYYPVLPIQLKNKVMKLKKNLRIVLLKKIFSEKCPKFFFRLFGELKVILPHQSSSVNVGAGHGGAVL